MRRGAAWRLAVGQLRAHPGRALLSGLAVVVGIAALVTVVAVAAQGRDAIRAEIDRTVGRAATFDAQVVGGNGGPLVLDDIVESRLVERFRSLGAEAVSPVVRSTVTVTQVGLGIAGQVEVLGVGVEYRQVRSLDVTAGRWLTEGDAEFYAPRVVLNAAADGQLAQPSALLLATDHPVAAEVVGVVDDGQSQPVVYASVEVLRRWDPGLDARGHSSYLVWVDPALAERFADRTSLEFVVDREDARLQLVRIDPTGGFDTVFVVLQAVLGGVAGIALVTGGIGIVNVSLVAVRQRARELALLRTFGLTPRGVFRMVLVESVIVTMAAGFVGVVVAAGLVATVPRLAGLPSTGTALPMAATVLGLGVSVVLGVLAGVVPARRATRLSVIRALRD